MFDNTTIDNRAETNSFKLFKYSFHFLSITAEILPDKLGKEAQQLQRHGCLGLQDGRRLWMKRLKRIKSSSAVNPRKTQALGTRFDKRSLGKSNAKTGQWWLLWIRDSAPVKYSQKSEKLKQFRSLTDFPVFVWKCFILELSCWREFDPTGCVGLIEIAQRSKPFSTPLHDTD